MSEKTSQTRGAVVLCGGNSRRMGRDKASLPFGEGQTLLGRTVASVSQALCGGPIVCVAAADQQLPLLPEWVKVVSDRTPDAGPLEGLATGLRALEGRASVVVSIGCDTPLVEPALIVALLDALSRDAPLDAAALLIDEHLQPLPAAYRTNLAERIDHLLDDGQRSLMSALDAACCEVLGEAFVTLYDPKRHSFLNCNTPEAYDEALRVHADNT